MEIERTRNRKMDLRTLCKMQHGETKKKENMKERLRHMVNRMRVSHISNWNSPGNNREKSKSNI